MLRTESGVLEEQREEAKRLHAPAVVLRTESGVLAVRATTTEAREADPQ
ncbi:MULTISPECIES: hypothetical protein [unclassified Streptomyces]|nr:MULTISPECIES: hypothetical protein [unclassified Streptomyces]